MATEINGTSGSSEVRGKLYANMKTHEEKSALGQDEFLKILVTQLKNQDPLQPMQDREFISQMATFSSLQQMTTMNTAMQDLRGMMLGQATSYVGKDILYKVNNYDPDTGELLGEETFQGTVMNIENEKNKTYLVTNKGHRITLDALLAITSEPSNPIVEQSHLIGKKITFGVINADGTMEEQTGIVKGITIKAGLVQAILDQDQTIPIHSITKVENS